MIRLFLARHAKSSWAGAGIPDHDRGLNDRGHRDLPRMSEHIYIRGWIPDRIISSTASRAKITAEAYAEKLLGDRRLVSAYASLYLCSAGEITRFLTSMDNSERSVMLVGHNPGITDFFNAYADVSIDNVPTCAVGSFYMDEEDWASAAGKKWKNDGFIYPKM